MLQNGFNNLLEVPICFNILILFQSPIMNGCIFCTKLLVHVLLFKEDIKCLTDSLPTIRVVYLMQ